MHFQDDKYKKNVYFISIIMKLNRFGAAILFQHVCKTYMKFKEIA